jgi:polysaccharide pyruvyl transferase WcaK-like protein
MLIPTIAMSYSHKVDGLIGKELHQEECIIDVRNLNFDTFLSELLLKIDYVWSNREKIHNELKAIMETIVKKALLNAELTVELLNSRSYASHYSEHDSMIY